MSARIPGSDTKAVNRKHLHLRPLHTILRLKHCDLGCAAKALGFKVQGLCVGEAAFLRSLRGSETQ